MPRIRLFLSSPGDVNPEREKVPAVVTEIKRIFDYLDVNIEVIDWKTHVAPDMGRPQEVINRQIGDYDIFVGIMWKRFGTRTGPAESGTEEEFRIAYKNWQRFQRPRIMFYFCLRPYMPMNTEESSQFLKVVAFREELQQKGLVWEYQSPEDFADALRTHLVNIVKERFLPRGEEPPTMADFKKYLRYLMSISKYIDIQGLVTGEGKAHRFRIDHLYIPLMTSSAGFREGKSATGSKKRLSGEESAREAPLQEALREQRLIIKGDPGAGKTTFLRLIAFTLCRKWLGEEDASGRTRLLWPEPPPLPILVPVGRLAEYLRKCIRGDLRHTSLSAEDFRKELEAGRCLILLDGLDEVPDPATRQKASSLASHLFEAFPDCQVVLTSRPAALIGPAMPANFDMVEIAPLDDQAIDTFLTQWSAALYPEEPEKTLGHKRELSSALECRPEIRRMARNPVMLTALAVVHWNEHRLPEQRSELYESIITWLVRAREQRSGRLKADRCRKLLQKLALAMFTHKEGRQRQVGLRWAAETPAPGWAALGRRNPG
jgi:hypothetical protein